MGYHEVGDEYERFVRSSLATLVDSVKLHPPAPALAGRFPQTVAGPSSASFSPKCTNRSKGKEKDTRKTRPDKLRQYIGKTRERTILLAGPARPPPLSMHPSPVLPLPLSPKGLGDYPPNQRIPQESNHRLGGTHIIEQRPNLRSPRPLPLAQCISPLTHEPCLTPPYVALGNELKAGLAHAGIAAPTRVVVDRPPLCGGTT